MTDKLSELFPKIPASLTRLLCLDSVQHSGRTLHQHLVGTFELLNQWNLPKEVCIAGLFHSIYGTMSFKPNVLTFELREELRELIGRDAEELVYFYCVMDRYHFLIEASEGIKDFSVLPTILQSETEIEICRDRTINLLLMLCADAVEQLPHRIPPADEDRSRIHLTNKGAKLWMRILSNLGPKPADMLISTFDKMKYL